MRSLLRRALKGSLEIVAELSDGETCASVVRELAVDVVVMDCHMPFPGDQATRQVKLASPEVTVVGYTAGDDTAARMEFARADAVFAKQDLSGLVAFLESL